MAGKKTILIIVGAIVLIAGLAVGIFLLQQQQDQRSKASESELPTVSDTATEEEQAQACATPGEVTNVNIAYPHCEGENCVTDKADCSWSSVQDAVSYKVKITEIDTNTVKQDVTVGGGTSLLVFDVIENNTYKCEVSAVNSCGSTGPAGSHQIVCKVLGTVTVAPTAPPSPTPTVPTTTVTQPPAPTSPPVTPITALPPTGSLGSTIFIGAAAALLFVAGGLLLVL